MKARRGTKRVRNQFDFTPQWDGPISGWVANFAGRNHWRVREVCPEYDDLVQECFIKFLHMCDTYPGVMEPAHFMALYKTAVNNMVNTMSMKATAHRDFWVDIDPDGRAAQDGAPLTWEDVASRLLPAEMHGGDFAVLLAEAPYEVQLLVSAFFDDNLIEELRGARLRDTEDRFARRETTNEFFCRVLGLDPATVNLPALLKEHFGWA